MWTFSKRLAVLAFVGLIATVAVAHTDGIYNRSANSVGDTQGIDSAAVSGGPAALACSYSPVTTGTQSVAYTGATPSASGGTPAYTFSETGSLPTGLTIASGTGIISGTPSVSGSFPSIQVKVTDSLSAVANCGAAFTLVIAPSSFTGPLDVVGSATAAYSLRAASAAARGTKAINLCDNTGANCSDVLTDGTTGKLANPGTHGANNCATSNTCTIATFYDQSGSLACGGSACDVTQATNANRATLTFSCLNSLPCAVFGGSAIYSNTSTPPVWTTGTYSSVAIRTAAFTTSQPIITYGNTQSVNLNFRQVASTMQMFQGTTGVVVANITDSNWHAFQAVYNGASSVLMCGGSAGTSCSTGGTSNSLNPGTTISNGPPICLGGSNSGGCVAGLQGQLTETIAWANTVFNGTQQTNMNANQFTFWGPF